ncbi:TetR/AcrR family transcriptional regulator [Porticoccaceae bacterium LTM1]|nr:TetR/AcrR family transcriptional regulator [Porticoccaceae bacterium LTM1]
MARTREFNPKEVIEKAVYLFWEKGYTDTSMDDLVKCTGVSRYGIYGEFGNKRELFLAALEHFQEKFTRELIQDLSHPDAGVVELRAYFQRLQEHGKTPESQMGCFMCNTAVELSNVDEEIGQRIRELFEKLRQVFLRALKNAQREGDIDSQMDLDEYASYLLGIQLGMAMVARSGIPEQRMKQYFDVALQAIN